MENPANALSSDEVCVYYLTIKVAPSLSWTNIFMNICVYLCMYIDRHIDHFVFDNGKVCRF